jgi:hypothetical protein
MTAGLELPVLADGSPIDSIPGGIAAAVRTGLGGRARDR